MTIFRMSLCFYLIFVATVPDDAVARMQAEDVAKIAKAATLLGFKSTKQHVVFDVSGIGGVGVATITQPPNFAAPDVVEPCPLLSDSTTGSEPISLIIRTRWQHMGAARRTAYHACVDQSLPAEQVIVVCSGVPITDLDRVDVFAQEFAPCVGQLVATAALLSDGDARVIGIELSRNTLTAFLSGIDIAGPQWLEAVRHMHATTSFPIMMHSAPSCGLCDRSREVGCAFRLNRQCPDRSNPDGDVRNLCHEGSHLTFCLNASSNVVNEPTPTKCFTADELSRAKVTILDPHVRGNFPRIAFSHPAISRARSIGKDYPGVLDGDDATFVRRLASKLWGASPLNTYDTELTGVTNLYPSATAWFDASQNVPLRDALKDGTWEGGPWGLGEQPHSTLASKPFRVGLYARIGLTCHCDEKSVPIWTPPWTYGAYVNAAIAQEREPLPGECTKHDSIAEDETGIIYGFAFDYARLQPCPSGWRFHTTPTNYSIETSGSLITWASSVRTVGARAVILHNRNSVPLPRVIADAVRIGNGSVVAVYIDPSSDPRYSNLVALGMRPPLVPNRPRHSPHNIRFYVLQDLLSHPIYGCHGSYCIVTDLFDVRFKLNPFQVMREEDSKLTGPALYVGDEDNIRTSSLFMATQFFHCFGYENVRIPVKWQGLVHRMQQKGMPLLNCGAFGARRDHFAQVIDDVVLLLGNARGDVCDMVALNLLPLLGSDESNLTSISDDCSIGNASSLACSVRKEVLMGAKKHKKLSDENVSALRGALAKMETRYRKGSVVSGAPFTCRFRSNGTFPSRCAIAHK